MPDIDPLIATRFIIPPVHADLVWRSDLNRLLDKGADLPLTLVSAPPGFGKTTLTAAWLKNKKAAGGTTCCWLSLHSSDNLPVTFWRYFTAVLQNAIPEFGAKILALLVASTPPPIETIVAYLINELAALSQPLILVLDDYHVVHLKSIHTSLNLLLDHLPENVHLILVTREDPQLSLARRRARQQMVEIRAADLRFGLGETCLYFEQVMHLVLNPEQLKAVDQRVEGWIVGLQLAALSLQGHADPQSFLQTLAGVDRSVADYLVEEVLQRQTKEVREFLLRTSVLDHLSAPLCEALMAGSPFQYDGDDDLLESPFASMLDRLERTNLFLIPLDNQHEWYRYHHLFAQLLRQRLRQLYGDTECKRLLNLASQWFEGQGDPAGAIRYAFQSGDLQRAAQLLERYAARFFIRADLPQFCAWVSEIPPAVRDQHPGLCMAAAWAGLATNQLQDVNNLLTGIEKHLGITALSALDTPDLEPGLKTILLEILVLRLSLDEGLNQRKDGQHFLKHLANLLKDLPDNQMGLFTSAASLKPVVAFNLGIQMETVGELQRAIQVFRDASELARIDHNHHIFLLSLGHLANVQMQLGDFEMAHQTFEEALLQATELDSSDSPFAALAYAGLGWLDYQSNHLAEAQEKFQTAMRLAHPWTNWESMIPAMLGLASIQRALDDAPAALRLIGDFLHSEKCAIPGLTLSLEAYQALLWAETGQTEEARKWLQKSGISVMDLFDSPNIINRWEYQTLAQVLILLDQLDEAMKLLTQMLEYAETSGQRPAAIQARVQLAKGYAIRGEIRQAVETLQEALRLAQANGVVRVFLDGGDTIRRLLMVVRSNLGASHPLAAYVRSILTYFVTGEEAYPVVENDGNLIEPLSDREREVLRLLADGLSNKEIAARLIISLATVKTHIANIYQKLDAASRTQAVARAEVLGLLLPR